MPAYKDEKRGTWYAKFNYGDWTGTTKQKMQRGFKTQKEAKAFERDFLSKSNASPNMAFGHFVDLYMEDCRSRLKPTTYENKEFAVNTKILPYFREMPLNSIEPATIRKWQNELLTHENNYSQTYLKTINNQLSAIFNFAMKYYKLPSNPARICGSMGKKNADEMNFWTLDEFNKFISKSDNPMYTTIYQILFWTGIRIGECLALTLNDFDLVEHSVNINKNYARHQKTDLILDPKTPKSKRTIAIPDYLSDIVRDFASKLYDYDPADRLFPFPRSTMNSHIVRIVKKAGVKRIRIHDLRHSHASLLIEMGVSPLLISERLGHENIETTLQTYSHLYPNKHGEVRLKLQEMTQKITNDTTEK
jgi:integrase